jgi:hypothetical protein
LAGGERGEGMVCWEGEEKARRGREGKRKKAQEAGRVAFKSARRSLLHKMEEAQEKGRTPPISLLGRNRIGRGEGE